MSILHSVDITAKSAANMNKRRLAIVSVVIGLVLTGLSALVQTNTGVGLQCAYPSGNGPLDELAVKYYPQKQLGLPLPYYVKQDPVVVNCFDITDRMVVEPGVRPGRLAADMVIWTGLVAGVIVVTQKISIKRHART